MYCFFNLSETFLSNSEKVTGDLAKVDTAFSLNIIDNVRFSFFNIQISHAALVNDGESEWQFISF